VRRLQRVAYKHNFQNKGEVDQFLLARKEFYYSLRLTKSRSFQSFCDEIRNMPSAARLYRALSGGRTIKLGPVQLPDGTYTPGAKETLGHLLQTHFPGDPNGQTGEGYDHTPSDSPTVDQITSEDQVHRVLGTFSPFKAAGPDEIFPALLSEGREVLTPILSKIMHACLRYGYIPQSWRKTRAVFIPKPGKDSYYRTSSWRPISLTSFLLKTLERLIDWYL
jgi:hypothetical protein